MKKFFALLLLMLPVSASCAENLTLEDAVRMGIGNNHLLKSKREQIESARSDLKARRLSRFGKANFGAMYTKSDDPSYVFGTSLKQRAFTMASMGTANDPDPLANYRFFAEAGIPLFTGFKIKNAVRAAKINVEKSEKEYRRADSGIKFRITYQWLTVLLRQKLLEFVGESVKSSEKEIETAQMLKEKGMVLGSDYYAAEAILGKLRNYKVEWQNSLRREKAKLNILLGRSPDYEFEIAGEFLERDFPALPMEEMLREAELLRNDLGALRAYGKMAAVFASMERNSIMPEISAFASVEKNTESFSDYASNYIYGLKVTLPVGDPSYFQRRNAAIARKRQADEMYRDYKEKVRKEFMEAYLDYRSARESVPLAKETFEKAKKSLELFRPMYRQGKQSIMEVLRAEATLLEARASYVTSIYKTNLFYARTMLAAEKFNDSAIGRIAAGTEGGKR